jgi:hypothetical protein
VEKEEEVLFLKGQGRMLNKLSPVKIVKNLDWSLAHQAAMWQVCIICTGIVARPHPSPQPKM